MVKTTNSKLWIDDMERDYCSYSKCKVKFGVVHRKHHCRCCGDIFCKIHCEKKIFKRNEDLELKSNINYDQIQPPYYYHDDRSNVNNLVNDDIDSNEREMRICPDCEKQKHLFVDNPHKHEFMNCNCLKWNVQSIDFQQQSNIFKSTLNTDD